MGTKQFHVYVTADGIWNAVCTEGLYSICLIEDCLPPNVNWYGTEATSPSDAIDQAQKAGLKYLPPEKMQALSREADNLCKQLGNCENV